MALPLIQNDQRVLIVGAKPLPSPLPEALKTQFAALGRELQAFSARIMEFSEDRDSAERMLPSRDSYGYDDPNAGSKKWQRGIDFLNDTESKFRARFGSQAAVFVAKLSEMGILIPFHVRASESHPAKYGKWFGAMGTLVEQGQIGEARRVSADDNLWFFN
ncbi:hypothetical protein [Bradyrhizobium guangdongense]